MGQAGFFTTRAGDPMTRDCTAGTADDLLYKVQRLMHTRGLLHVLLLGADKQPLSMLNPRTGLRVLLTAGNHEEALLRHCVVGVGHP